MYGLPRNFDPTLFVGRTIELVSFTSNTVHLAFSGDRCSLTIESSFEHNPGVTGRERVHSEVPVVESGLMRLVGRSVAIAEVEGEGTLFLRFDDGQTLRLFDDSEEYESYRIDCNGLEIVV